MSGPNWTRAAQVLGGLLAGAVCLMACTPASGRANTTTVNAPTTTAPPPVVASADVTPKGWVPVDYGGIQLSVPSDWHVSYHRACWEPTRPGTLAIGNESGYCPAYFANLPFVGIATFPKLPVLNRGHHISLNGIPAEWYSRGSQGQREYLVPRFRASFFVQGPLGEKVMHTLTYSTRAVVLAKGPLPGVPRTWRWLAYGGVRFAVPPSWPVDQTSETFISCYFDWQVIFSGLLAPRTAVMLSTDTDDATINCPLVVVPRRLPAPTNGLRLDLRWHWPAPALVFSSHCLDIHGLRVCPSETWNYSVLFASVHVAGRATPVTLMLGMAGDGQVARTILYSFRPVQASSGPGPQPGKTVSLVRGPKASDVVPPINDRTRPPAATRTGVPGATG